MDNRLGIMEIARKAMFLGLGAVSLTKEKTEQLIEELAQKGELTQSEAREFVNRMAERGKAEQAEFKKMFKVEMENFMSEMPVVSRKDFEALQERLVRLEAKLGEQETK